MKFITRNRQLIVELTEAAPPLMLDGLTGVVVDPGATGVQPGYRLSYNRNLTAAGGKPDLDLVEVVK